MTGVLRKTADASNDDLVRDVIEMTRYSIPFVSAHPLPRSRAAKMCHTFLRDKVSYVEELGDQYIRAPWRTIADQRADCKSFAVFIASLCRAAGCRVSLKFVDQDGEGAFDHVYVLVDGVPVDPCLHFGEECAYIAARTVPIH